MTLLVDLGVKAPAARTLLARMRAANLLGVRREGRVVVYTMRGALAERYHRIRIGNAESEWDGRFHVIVHEIPEPERVVRERLRTQSDRLGYAQLRPGVLVSPWDRTADLTEEIAAASDGGAVYTGWLQMTLEEGRMLVRRAFELEDLGTHIRHEIAVLELARDDHPQGAESLRTAESVQHKALDLIGRVANVPPVLLPPNWPAGDLERALNAFREQRYPAMRDYLKRRVVESGYSPLVEQAREQ